MELVQVSAEWASAVVAVGQAPPGWQLAQAVVVEVERVPLGLEGGEVEAAAGRASMGLERKAVVAVGQVTVGRAEVVEAAAGEAKALAGWVPVQQVKASPGTASRQAVVWAAWVSLAPSSR